MKFLLSLLILMSLVHAPQASAKLNCWEQLKAKIWNARPSSQWQMAEELTVNADGNYSLYDLPVAFFSADGNPVLRLKFNQPGVKFRPTQFYLPSYSAGKGLEIGLENLTRKNPVYAFVFPDSQLGVLNVIVLDGHHRTFRALQTGEAIYVEISSVRAPEDWHIRSGAWYKVPIF